MPLSAASSEGALSDIAAVSDERAPTPDPIPILWHSNAPWVGTGYGAQTALFAPLLAEQLGYRVALSAFYGLKGSRLGWVSPAGHPYIVYPSFRDAYGNDVLGAHMRHWFEGKKGLVITLTDPWVLHDKIMQRIPTLAWTPVDHVPLMPRTNIWFNNTGAYPLAMSRFGQEQLVAAGYDPCWYVPHGYNPNVFQPEDREAARASLKIPQSAFVVLMVAANRGVPSRKGFAQAIPAFAEFKEKHPEAILYLHTKMEEIDGEELHVMCRSYGVRPMLSDQYGMALGHPPGLVARLMNAADVLLNPSHGEGFGVPLIESQACGTPCIVTNFSAMPEVAPAKHGNWNVDGQMIWTALESEQMVPDREGIVDALNKAYGETNAKRLARREKVLRWVDSQYRADKVIFEHWEPVIPQVLAEIDYRQSTMERF